jgi:acetolactate synthase-1/3 small subunit
MKAKENTISLLVRNRPDVLARIAGTFSGRGFNIESITANITKTPETTKIIITTKGSASTMDKLMKQLNRIVDVISVDDLTGRMASRRELVLFRMKWNDESRPQVMAAIDRYNWKVVCMNDLYCVIEVSGRKDSIDRAIQLLDPLGLEDFSRSGTVALEKFIPE